MVLAGPEPGAVVLEELPIADATANLDDDDDSGPAFCYCGACGQSNREEVLLLCDCPTHADPQVAYHSDCIGLADIPMGDWYCPICAANANSASHPPVETAQRRGRLLNATRGRVNPAPAAAAAAAAASTSSTATSTAASAPPQRRITRHGIPASSGSSDGEAFADDDASAARPRTAARRRTQMSAALNNSVREDIDWGPTTAQGRRFAEWEETATGAPPARRSGDGRSQTRQQRLDAIRRARALRTAAPSASSRRAIVIESLPRTAAQTGGLVAHRRWQKMPDRGMPGVDERCQECVRLHAHIQLCGRCTRRSAVQQAKQRESRLERMDRLARQKSRRPSTALGGSAFSIDGALEAVETLRRRGRDYGRDVVGAAAPSFTSGTVTASPSASGFASDRPTLEPRAAPKPPAAAPPLPKTSPPPPSFLRAPTVLNSAEERRVLEEEERVRARRKAAKKVEATPALPPPATALPPSTPPAAAAAAPVSVWLRSRRKPAAAASPGGAAKANPDPNPSAEPTAARAKSSSGGGGSRHASEVEPARKRKRPFDPAAAAAREQNKAREKHGQASDVVKEAMKPFWKFNKITKDQYKAVCKAAVRAVMKYSRPWPPGLADTLVKESVGRCLGGVKCATDAAAASSS